MSWVTKLQQFNKDKSKLNVQDTEQKDEQLFSEYYHKFKGTEAKKQKESSHIPRFYSKPPREGDVLQQKLREEARAVFLQKRSSDLMDNEELQKLWVVLEEKHTPPDVSDEQMIGYLDYMSLRDEVSERCKSFFTPKVFTKLLKDDPLGRVSITQLFSYIMRKVWLQQTRIGLSLFDIQGLGFLRESDLENYILELIPTLPQLNCLEESFYSFYVCTAVRKFFFFLDPMKTGIILTYLYQLISPYLGRIKIQDILGCGFLDDLLELRDEDMTPESQESNWFSAQSSLRVYGQYLSLDTNHNGMLSKDELLRYGTGTLTTLFIDRVFQECLTYEGEVDYKTYLDFVLAMEYKREPQSLQYFFRLLDINGQGYLTAFTINYFFRAILDLIKTQGYETVRVEDIRDEIFDMIKPTNPDRITLSDLINSGHGETMVAILTDFNGFLTYENREATLAEGQEGTYV